MAVAFEGRHCADCGYDLRGLSELRCPECGHGFEPRARPVEPAAPSAPLMLLGGAVACCLLIVGGLVIPWTSTILESETAEFYLLLLLPSLVGWLLACLILFCSVRCWRNPARPRNILLPAIIFSGLGLLLPVVVAGLLAVKWGL